MLDIPKAFYSIDRTTRLSHLEKALTESEMYMMNILINDVVINVQYGMERSADILRLFISSFLLCLPSQSSQTTSPIY